MDQTASPKEKARRITFVDLLRLVASFQMVAGHTIDGLLSQELRQGAVFDAWTSVRGLTSVAFMVAAGLSFHLSTLARFDRHKADPANVKRRLKRGLFLVAVGYALHLPLALFGDDPAIAARAVLEFQIADVLQCIGLSILALEGITLVARRPGQVVVSAAVLATMMFALGPLADTVVPDGPTRFLTNYVSHRGGSLFPLVPWAGFLFAGVVLGAIALPSGSRTPPAWPAPRLLIVAILVIGAGFAVDALDLSAGVSRNAQPAFNLLKLGVVTGVIAILAFVGQRIARLPRAAAVLAGETLSLYVSHLFVLYTGHVGLYRLFGHSLSLAQALGVAAVMLVGTAAFGLGWHRVKASRRS